MRDARVGTPGEDALLERIREEKIKEMAVGISNENLRKIHDIYQSEDSKQLILRTVDSVVTINLPAGGSWLNIFPALVMTRKPLGGATNQAEVEMTLPEKRKFLEDFPVSKLYIAFQAAGEELKRIQAEKDVSKI